MLYYRWHVYYLWSILEERVGKVEEGEKFIFILFVCYLFYIYCIFIYTLSYYNFFRSITSSSTNFYWIWSYWRQLWFLTEIYLVQSFQLLLGNYPIPIIIQSLKCLFGVINISTSFPYKLIKLTLL